MPSIGSSCFDTFKQKLSLYVVFIMMDIAESCRQLGMGVLLGRERRRVKDTSV
jgi:hypothetical protein